MDADYSVWNSEQFGVTRYECPSAINVDGVGRVVCVETGAVAPAGEGIPVGVIVMWSGSVGTIPSGWALCDGTQGTPDLRDRFVVGAGSGITSLRQPGATGGASSHTHAAHAYTPWRGLWWRTTRRLSTPGQVSAITPR